MLRCARCVLPETYPRLTFEGDGTCSVCREWESPPVLGIEALREVLSRKQGKKYDALVAISGGRDSMYTLHLAVKELGLKVIAASFDNGFRTEQAMKNMLTACSVLDVPFIDINSGKKLARQIVKDTLHYYIPRGPLEVNTHVCGACTMGARSGVVTEALRAEAPFILMGSSKTEALSRDYKALLRPRGGRLSKLTGANRLAYMRRVYHLTKLRLQLTPGRRRFGLRPLDLDKLPVQLIRIFDYVEWDKNVIEGVIRRELGWSEPVGANRSWRIDCDLGHINHYCSMRACGTTTLEVGYSNMIREGKMTRDEALSSMAQMRWDEYTDDLDTILTELKIPEDLKNRFRDYPREYQPS